MAASHGSASSPAVPTPPLATAVTCTGDGALRLWELTAGRARPAADDSTLQDPGFEANTVVWNHSCQVLGSGSRDGTIALIFVQNAARLTTFSHGEEVTAMAFSDSSRYLCSASAHFTKIWDLRQATKREGGGTSPIKSYRAPAPVTCVSFDFDQKQLAAACGHTVQLYDLTTGKAKAMRFKNAVTSVAYSPHQTKTLLTADEGGTVCVLDTAASRVLKRFSSIHPGGATCVSHSRSTQPHRFFSCGADGTAVMYSMDSSEAPVVVDIGVAATSIDAMPDGVSAVVGDVTGNLSYVNFRRTSGAVWTCPCSTTVAATNQPAPVICVRVANPTATKTRRRRTPGTSASRGSAHRGHRRSDTGSRRSPGASGDHAGSEASEARTSVASDARSHGSSPSAATGVAAVDAVISPVRPGSASRRAEATSPRAQPAAARLLASQRSAARMGGGDASDGASAAPTTTSPARGRSIVGAGSSENDLHGGGVAASPRPVAADPPPVPTPASRRHRQRATSPRASGNELQAATARRSHARMQADAAPHEQSDQRGRAGTRQRGGAASRGAVARSLHDEGVDASHSLATAAGVAPGGAAGTHRRHSSVGSSSGMGILLSDVDQANEARFQSIVSNAVEPLVQPLRHAVRDLHLELLRQLQIQQVQFSKQLADHNAALAAVYAEVEQLRKENAMLKRLY